MAWYYRTYACGHEGRVNVTGKTEERMQMQKQRKKQQKTISPS